jgi:hypothetical protein
MKNPNAATAQMAQMIVPSREYITEQQVVIVLSAIREMYPGLINEDCPKEARLAAEATFMGLCDRLDKIVADEARWSMTGTSNFYDELAETQKAQQEFLSTQTAAASIVLRPSYIHRPTLMRDDTNFYAVWGDSTIPGGAIIGVGATPNAALADFDAAFDRAPKDQLSLIIESENQTPEETQPPKASDE